MAYDWSTTPNYDEHVRDRPGGSWVQQTDGSWNVEPPDVLARRTAKAWVTPALGTNVTSFSGFQVPAFLKDTSGVVTTRGAVGFTGVVSSGGVLLTLPVGCRPSGTLALAVPSSSGIVRVDVLATGDISCNGTGFTTGGFLSLAGIRFPSEA